MKTFAQAEKNSRDDEIVHGQFRPVDVRSGERIQLVLKATRGHQGISYDVWRMSPFGLELIDRGQGDFETGQKIVAVLTMADQTLTYTGVVIAINVQSGKRRLLTVRLDPAAAVDRSKDSNVRKDVRWKCHPLFFPTVVARNKVRFNDKMMFRVVDISSGGLGLLTSMRNKYAVVGTQFEARVQVPSIGEFTVAVCVVHLSVIMQGDTPSQMIGVRFLKQSKRCMTTLGQYILQFGSHENLSPSPALLKKQGFSINSIADAVDFDIVRSEDEYNQVLNLRSKAYMGVAGLGVTMTPEDMADVYDARSRILVCRYRKVIVATLRLCFHGPDDQFEEEQHITFPKGFPPRHLVVEASRAATHPDFRGSDLYLNVLRYTMLMTLQSGRRWIVQSTYKQIIPIYEKVGFKRLKVSWESPKCPGEPLHLLLGDCQAVLDGSVGNPLTWNTLVPDIAHLIEENEQVRLSWVAKKRLAIFKALNPLYRFYERVMLEKRMQKTHR